MGKLEGKVAIITGGGKGIGFGLAKAFAKEGANLTITGRTMSRLKAAKEKLEAEYGVKVLPITADGANEASVANVVKQTVETFGRIDTVVNNAQVSKSGVMLKDHTKEDFDLAIYSGLYAAFFYMRDAYPYLKESKGSVINFSSMAAFRPLTRVCGYAAAKAGISNFTAFMATECAKKFGEGIRVNAIAPGFFLTEQNRSLLTNPDGTYTKRGQDVIRQTPFGRMGEPEELCGTIHYLMSDAAKFVTGTVAVVDGGFNVFAM